jgi:rhodanese-related sulfurtransferase
MHSGRLESVSLQIPEVEVSQLTDDLSDDVLVLDVREHYEWTAGHIAGAAHIPMMSVPARLAEIPTDREVLVVCRVGIRSAQVTGFLLASGRDAVNLAGGMVAWASAGRPMVADSPVAPTVL